MNRRSELSSKISAGILSNKAQVETKKKSK